LIIEDDEGRRSIVPVDLGDVSLGRHEGSVIRLKERNVSRRHARLALEDDGRVFVYDLDSYNGLWANGDRISGRFELCQGDVLRIGDFQLELKGESLKPRREEATQRTRVQDVQGTPPSTEPEFAVSEPTQVDADVSAGPPDEAGGGEPGVIEPTVTAITLPPQAAEPGPTLQAIMQEATALIRNPVTDEPSEAEPVVDAALQPPYAKLLCLTTQLAGQEFLIDQGETVIGRTKDNEIAINHRSISRHHAKILVSNQRYCLMDLDSANGTLVNGEIYAKAELKRGDIIELGHIRLRFVPPGDAASWSVDEQNQLARMEARRRKRGRLWRNSPVLMFLLVGSAIIGLGVAFTTNRTPRVMPQRPNAEVHIEHTAASVAQTQVQQQNEEARERLLIAARHALAQHQFKKAEGLAQEILQIDAACDEAQAMLHLCAMEKKSQAALDTANQAMQNSHWSDAYNAVQDIPKESSIYTQGQALLAQIKPGLIDERLADCKQAIQKEDWDEAELLIEEMTTLDAQRPELSELKSSVRDGRAKHPGASHTSRNSSSAGRSRKDRDKEKDKDKDAAKSASASSRSAQGATGTPATALAPTSTQPPPPSAAAVLATASRPAQGRDPKAMYAEGTKLLAAKQYSRAIEEFQKCISADKNFAMCYRALGIAHADANNGAEAVRYYRLYLKVDPSARDAAQVRTLLQQWDQSQPTQSQQAP
jgi:pSer/pThr/pTyr-binding forkhead associated (FHA) protein